MLAGDHLKAAADLGVPLVGVGLLYRGGYFKQGLDGAGRQTEDYQPVDPETLGLRREPVSVEIDLAGERIEAAVWRYDVGREHAEPVPLYLLEVDWLTDALYGGDREHRIRQELLLGVGGVRALAALGIEPTVFHMNEGHSAFLAIERVRALVAEGDVDRRGDGARARLVGLHDAHAGSRRQRGLRRRVRRSATSAPLAAEAGLHRRGRCSRSAASATKAASA